MLSVSAARRFVSTMPAGRRQSRIFAVYPSAFGGEIYRNGSKQQPELPSF
jgi:hypothetical protein